MRRLKLVLLAVFLAGSAARAVQPDEIMSDPALEARARALSGQLRCMVCQNQSIDDSDAPLARDIRLLVRERLKAGDDEVSIRSFLVARYGNFILLKPPFNAQTALLWFTPVLVIGLGALVAWHAFSRPGRSDAGGRQLGETDAARLAALLAPDE